MNLEKLRELKSKVRKGQHSIGTWMQISHPSIANVLAANGYEWIAIDMEHGLFNSCDLPGLFQAMRTYGASPFVRLAVDKRKDIKIALDSGAEGLIIPMIENKKQLQEAISEIFYPPKGKRGVGFSQANTYGKDFKNYLSEINDSLIIVAQIESISAIENLDELVAVKEVDAFMIGPYDLSASMGIAGQFDHPDFLQALSKFQEICQRTKKTMGYHVVQPNLQELELRKDEGYGLIAYGLDGTFLQVISKFQNIDT